MGPWVRNDCSQQKKRAVRWSRAERERDREDRKEGKPKKEELLNGRTHLPRSSFLSENRECGNLTSGCEVGWGGWGGLTWANSTGCKREKDKKKRDAVRKDTSWLSVGDKWSQRGRWGSLRWVDYFFVILWCFLPINRALLESLFISLLNGSTCVKEHAFIKAERVGCSQEQKNNHQNYLSLTRFTCEAAPEGSRSSWQQMHVRYKCDSI